MKKNYLIIGIIAGMFFVSCKKWGDHIDINNPSSNKTLMEQISDNADLSVFADYLKKAGLDSLLNSSKNFTVFAPDNSAMKSLPSSIVSDASQLKALLLNLISGKAYYTRDEADTLRIAMLNGKRVSFRNNQFDDANILTGDAVARNGVLHIVDKAIVPLPNIWEFINQEKGDYSQNAYIASLNYLGQDPNLAEVDSINPATGEPVYKPNTGIVEINTYRTGVYDIANEDSLYTYILLTNDAFNSQKISMEPYFKAGSEDTSALNASWSVVRDLTVSGLYTADRLSPALVSKFGVHITLDPSSVITTRKMSNGIVYIVDNASIPVSEKIPTVYVQGETPVDFSSTSATTLAKIFYRERSNPLTGQAFQDIYMNLGSSGANFYADYVTNDLYTTRYKVYWVALNDHVISGQGDDSYGTDSTLDQIIKISPYNSPDSILFNATGTVQPNTYSETYIGDFTNNNYNWLLSYPLQMPDGTSYLLNPATINIRLQAPASAVGRPYNLTLDYLKFVPVFN